MLRESRLVLLLGVHLEIHDISLVLGDRFIVANHNLVCTLGDQSHIVGNDDHTTLEILQTSRKSINRLHVKRIGRLIQQKQMRPFVGDDGKDDARLLTRTKLVHHLRLHSPSTSVSS